jgi:hypothetical protein
MRAAAAAVLVVHLAFVLWVILGALVTRGRPWAAALHLASLAWAVAVEAGPWPCPLTDLEQSLQARAGMTPYTQSFLVHYLDRLIYPNLPEAWLTAGAVIVCGLNLAVYGRRIVHCYRRRGAGAG